MLFIILSYLAFPSLPFPPSLSSADPMDVHAQMIVTVMEESTEKVSVLDIVAVARIGSTTKKSIMYAAVDDHSGEISYMSFNWMGNM